MTEKFECTDCDRTIYSFGINPTPGVPICGVCQFLRQVKPQVTPEEYARMRSTLLAPDEKEP